jgi:tetratricopeptide (TPR) repeat protein
MVKDDPKAHAAFSKARVEQEKVVQAQPDYAPAICVAGLIDAALGNKEAALQEGRRAVELLPMEKDATDGANMIQFFALTAAWADEKELALEQLERGRPLRPGSTVCSYGALKLLPFWDPLRGDPRFEKIVASFAPKQ